MSLMSYLRALCTEPMCLVSELDALPEGTCVPVLES